MVSQSVVVCLALLAAASATNVRQCTGKSFDNLSNDVELLSCNKLPCQLKRGRNQHISINFTPEKDITIVRNKVSADLFGGLNVPFIGVDGISVCDKLTTTSGENATCPLRAGTTYTYKDQFPVLSIYPTIKVDVRWELEDENEKSLVCFKVPARIS